MHTANAAAIQEEAQTLEELEQRAIDALEKNKRYLIIFVLPYLGVYLTLYYIIVAFTLAYLIIVCLPYHTLP